MTGKGSASYNVMKRIRGCAHPSRQIVGYAWRVPLPSGQPLPIPLAKLHDMARAMLLDMAQGVNPKAKRKAEQAAAAKSAKETFGAIAEEFLADHVAGLRTGREIEAIFRNTLLPAFGTRSVTSFNSDSSRAEIAHLIRGIAKARPAAAHRVFKNLSKFFNWTIEQGVYGLTISPCATLKAKSLCGAPVSRDRVLTNTELAAVWQAAAQLSYPWGPFLHVLVLTGQRLSEVANMSWGEIDLVKGLWTIPASRMKGKIAHVVPLVPVVTEILARLPRFGGGEFVFSPTGGRKAINSFTSLKKRVDALMPETAPWRFHDLRRSMRTGLSSLRVPDKVAELTIAHAQPGLHKVYDQHAYLDEKREALALWAAHVAATVEPKDDNVIRLRG